MRILLAEDDELLGDGLRAGLRQAGFQVDWVRDGAAADAEAPVVEAVKPGDERRHDHRDAKSRGTDAATDAA